MTPLDIAKEALEVVAHRPVTVDALIATARHALSDIAAIEQQGGDGTKWKCGNEYAPYHPSASHVDPQYRDGWNACYAAGRASAATELAHAQMAAQAEAKFADEWRARAIAAETSNAATVAGEAVAFLSDGALLQLAQGIGCSSYIEASRTAEYPNAVYLSPQPPSNVQAVTFSKRGGKMAFSVGVQTFTLDYEPENEEEFSFMRNMLTNAFARIAQPASAQAVRDQALEDAAIVCDAQAKEPECPERAMYCADAIRALKGKP